MRDRDRGKVVAGCDGYFTVHAPDFQGVRHPGKTAQDRMPIDKRPRVQAANARRTQTQEAARG